MKKNPWLKKIIIMALIIFLFGVGLKQYSKYYPEHLLISYKLVLVSAYYQPEVPTNPAKLTFTQIVPDNNRKPRVLKTTEILNITPAHRDMPEPFGKTGNLIQSEENNKYFFFGTGYDASQADKYYQFFPIWYDNKSEKIIVGKKEFVKENQCAGYPSGIDSREETILHSNGFITAVPQNKNADTLLKTMTIKDSDSIMQYSRDNFMLRERKNIVNFGSGIFLIQASDIAAQNLLIFTSAEEEKCRSLISGYYPFHTERPDVTAPLGVSPDHRKIAYYASEEPPVNCYEEVWLYVSDIDGQNTQKVFKSKAICDCISQTYKPYSIQWNPVDNNVIAVNNSAGIYDSPYKTEDALNWENLVARIREKSEECYSSTPKFFGKKCMKVVENYPTGRIVQEEEKKIITDALNHISGDRNFTMDYGDNWQVYNKGLFVKKSHPENYQALLRKGIVNMTSDEIKRYNRFILNNEYGLNRSEIPAIYLINIREKTTKLIFTGDKEVFSPIKNFRWAPDGKQIGIIDYHGRVHVYKIKDDSLKLVSGKSECFDFFWVE